MADKKNKKKLPKVRTSAGIAAYSYIHAPDTGKKFSDNKYKIDVVVDNDDPCILMIRERCDEAAVIEWGKKPKRLDYPLKDGDAIADAAKKKYPNEPDYHKEEFRGKTLIRMKSKFQPSVIDAKRKELPKGVEIRAGDLVKASALCWPYENEEKVKNADGEIEKVTVFGISLQFRGVQLLEKRAIVNNAADDFDDEDDYDSPVARNDQSDDDDDSDDEDDF